jgi:hypothetical protein
MNFREDQERLSARIRDGELRLVTLEPDGTWPGWLAVVIQRPTGVAYCNQCGGVSTQQRLVEGYLVPLAGPRFNPDTGPLDSAPFRDIFHRGTSCQWIWTGTDLPSDRLALLAELISDVPYWHFRSEQDGSRERLELDPGRISELCEAWIPVLTPDGAGIFLFDNCD